MAWTSDDWARLGIDNKGREWAGFGSPNLKTRCPQGCSARQNKQDLSINLETGAYCCKNPGCGFQGYLGGAAPRVVERQGGQTHIATSRAYDRSKFTTMTVEEYWTRTRELPQEALDYLHGRGFTDDTITRCGLRWGPVYKDEEEDRWIHGVWTPYIESTSDGERVVVNIKKRPLDKERPMGMMGGGEITFYGAGQWRERVGDEIRARERMVIVEGEFDAIALWQAGIYNAMSVPNGTPDDGTRLDAEGKPLIQNASLAYLDAFGDRLDQVRAYVMFGDDDKPGRILQAELVRRIGPERCFFVEHPEGCKDANDVLLKYGPEKLRDLVANARPYPVKGLARPKDMLHALRAWKRDGMPSGFSTGWTALDEIWRPVPGQLTIVTGVPSHGKSEFLDALLINLHKLHGWRGVVFSPEAYPPETQLVRMLEKHVGKPFDDKVAAMWAAVRYPGVTAMTGAEIDAAVDELQAAFTWILPDVDDSDGITLDRILAYTRGEVYRNGAKLLVVDPWNEIEHLIPPGMREDQYVSKALSKLRRFARQTGVHVFLVAHPTKMMKVKDKIGDREIWTYPIPTLYDVSGGANWKNKADNGLVIWRDVHAEERGDDPHLNTIRADKVKLKWTGKTGASTQLRWYPPTGQYFDVSIETPSRAIEAQTQVVGKPDRDDDGQQEMYF